MNLNNETISNEHLASSPTRPLIRDNLTIDLITSKYIILAEQTIGPYLIGQRLSHSIAKFQHMKDIGCKMRTEVLLLLLLLSSSLLSYFPSCYHSQLLHVFIQIDLQSFPEILVHFAKFTLFVVARSAQLHLSPQYPRSDDVRVSPTVIPHGRQHLGRAVK